VNRGPGKTQQPLLTWLIRLFACFLPISIALSEPLALVAVPVWLCYEFRQRKTSMPPPCPLLVPVLLFALVVLCTSVFGLRPETSMRKWHRLLFLLLIFMIPASCRSRMTGQVDMDQVRMLAGWFIAGVCIMAVYDLIRVPVQTILMGRNLYDTGNMRDPQFYMTALCLLSGWMLTDHEGRVHVRWAGMATALCALGLLIHFKRGNWLAFGMALFLMSAISRRWKVFTILAALAAVLLFIPAVHHRLELITQEFDPAQGGRFVLWMQVAPALISRYPFGMGFCAMRHQDFEGLAPYVQPRLSHLHNNLLQVTAESGWAGLFIWTFWMVLACLVLLNMVIHRRPSHASSWMALGAFGGLTGLLLNGLVESNFGDSEILMLLCLLMGLCCALYTVAASGAENLNGRHHGP
jgi:O-antigen ligase